MSYTLAVPPSVVRGAETYADSRGVSLDDLVCDYLVMIAKTPSAPARNQIQFGLMKDEIKLPADFDEEFDALDDEVASAFVGA